ncbi:MAG: vitamin K epoxide reductase family protein [Limnospira sp.]
MVPSRSAPWIYRHSRTLIFAIATLGAIETAYLTGVKLLGRSAICPTQGCHDVLNSSYATVFGLPISLFGFLAYLSMAALAAAPGLANPDTQKVLRAQLEGRTWWPMFALGTAMAVMSGFLMYLLAFELHALCPYCIASATFSVTLFLLTLIGRPWEDFGQQALVGVAVTMVALVAVLGVYGGKPTTATETAELVNRPITTESGPAELSLARHLKEMGIQTYGAYWCPHCYEQKQLFGRQAFSLLDYVECDPNGNQARPQLCRKAGIKAYPSWEIDGEIYPGRLALKELAKLSNYRGRQDFLNSR